MHDTVRLISVTVSCSIQLLSWNVSVQVHPSHLTLQYSNNFEPNYAQISNRVTMQTVTSKCKKNVVLNMSPKGYKLTTLYFNLSRYKNIFIYQEFNIAHYSLLSVHSTTMYQRCHV